MGSQVQSQNRQNDHFGGVRRNFFFRGKKVDWSIFWAPIDRRLLCCSNYFIIISESQSKVEKTKFFILFSTFDRDPEIVMEWFQRHSDSRFCFVTHKRRIRLKGTILVSSNFRLNGNKRKLFLANKYVAYEWWNHCSFDLNDFLSSTEVSIKSLFIVSIYKIVHSKMII